MHVLVRFILYTIIIIYPPINFCKSISNNSDSPTQEVEPQCNDVSIRKARNGSIFNDNYAKVPAELSDPNYGIVNYDKQIANSSAQSDSTWFETINRMRSIDLDAEKYANVFSKAFAAGFSAALVDKQLAPQQRGAEITKEKLSKAAVKGNSRSNSPVKDRQAASSAAGRNKIQTEKAKKDLVPKQTTMPQNSDNLPFNITSDAVGYGAAYASGYALAAADRAARMSNYSHGDVKPWKMNNAAAAGYAAYYAAAIAQSRAVRHPDNLEGLLQDDASKVESGGEGEGAAQGKDAAFSRDRKGLAVTENALEDKTGDLSANGVGQATEGKEAIANRDRKDVLPTSNAMEEQSLLKEGTSKSLDQTSSVDQDSPKSDVTVRNAAESVTEGTGVAPDEMKKQRNVEVNGVLEGRDRSVQELTVNIEQSPSGGTMASLTQNDTRVGRNQDDENLDTHLIIQNSGDKFSVADKSNADLTLDIDPSSLDNKRHIGDEAKSENVTANAEVQHGSEKNSITENVNEDLAVDGDSSDNKRNIENENGAANYLTMQDGKMEKNSIVDRSDKDLTLDNDPLSIDNKRHVKDGAKAENIADNLITQDGGDKNSIADKSNEADALDNDQSCSDSKRHVDKAANDGSNVQQGVDEGLDTLREPRRFSDEAENAIVDPNKVELVEEMYGQLQNFTKRKRHAKYGKRKRRRKKKKKIKSTINYNSL